jgi:alpha-1,2-mannosyltransferase
MELARAYAGSHQSGIYDEVFFQQGVKFQYPPTALLFFGRLERPTLNVLSWIATVLTAVIAAAILRRSLHLARPTEADRQNLWPWLDIFTLVAALSFYPLIKAYTLGQIQSWLNLLFAGAILLWITGARATAGAVIAVMCLIKPTYALLFAWGALRREWPFVLTGATVVCAGLALSLWRHGLGDHLAYLRVLSYIGRRGEAFYPNQSFNGALNRLLANGSNLEWRDHEFAPVNAVVVAGTVVAFVVLIALAMWPPAKGASGSVLDFSVVALAVTMTAPVAWEHHYGILVPIYAAITPDVLTRRPLGRWTLPALAASYVLVSNYFLFTNHFAATWLNSLQSYLLGGALLLWLLIFRTEHRALPAPAR